MEAHQPILQPLIPSTTTSSSTSPTTAAVTTTTTSTSSSSFFHNKTHYADADTIKNIFSSNSAIITRLLLVLSAAVISMWANYKASKTLEITIINNAKGSPLGQRFDLFYVSNDRAIRTVLDQSQLIENFLYPNTNNITKKHINRVTLRLASHRLASSATAVLEENSGEKSTGDYVIDLCPSLLEGANYNRAIELAIRRAMIRIWLWDGESKAPISLIDGVVEYLSEIKQSGGRDEFTGGIGLLPAICNHVWWEERDPISVARVLRFFERRMNGFIQRLNQAMIDRWHDWTVDDVLGMTSQQLCDSTYGSPSAA